MRPAASTLIVALALSFGHDAWAVDAGAPDGASLDQELRELEKTRKEFETLTKQLDEQRRELERQTERAESQKNLTFVAAGVAVLVVSAAGVAWLRRRTKKKIDSA